MKVRFPPFSAPAWNACNLADALPLHLQASAPTWDADALANAVPLRLSQWPAFDAARDGPLPPCANDGPSKPRQPRDRYLRARPMPPHFSVH